MSRLAISEIARPGEYDDLNRARGERRAAAEGLGDSNCSAEGN